MMRITQVGNASTAGVHLGAALLGVDLLHDWVKDSVELLGLGFVLLELGVRLTLKPAEGLVAGLGDGLLVLLGNLTLEFGIVQLGLALVAEGLEAVPGLDLLLEDLILGLVELGLLDHGVDLVL